MRNSRQTAEISAREDVIRRPVYWPVFFSIMFLASFLLCFWDTPSTDTKELFDIVAVFFYAKTGFSIWIPIAVIFFVLSVINLYICVRFKLVIHGHGFTVTPILGETHEVAFSAVEKVTHSKRFSSKGYYIDIEYDDKKIHLPYTRNRKGALKQKSIDVLLKKFADCKTTVLTP